VGAQEKIILLDSVAIMLAIIVPTILAILAFAFWFRASNPRAVYRPKFVYSGRIELLVWSIPALTIMFLGGIAWTSAHDLDPAKPLASPVKPLEVQVVAMDWKWLFIYPTLGVASINHLEAPVGVPLHFEITSASVMNVFFVPRLGSQIYAMNGMTSQLNLMASQPGDFPGFSGFINGDGFADMHFDVQAVPAARFEAWAAQARATSPALDAAAYDGLRRQSANLKPITFRSVQPDLYNAIVTQKLAPGTGPKTAPAEWAAPERES
jgi:cytochrome o ubiquinol oxidase subunit 2